MPSLTHSEYLTHSALGILLGGDAGKIMLVLRVFHRSVSDDLRQMELAVSAGHWTLLQPLADRVALSCRHIGEAEVALAFVALARAAGDTACEDSVLVGLFERARTGLVSVLSRTAPYLDCGGEAAP